MQIFGIHCEAQLRGLCIRSLIMPLFNKWLYTVIFIFNRMYQEDAAPAEALDEE